MKINPGNARGLLVPQGDRPFSFVVYSSEIRDFGFNITAAIGGYDSEQAMAIGTGYRFNENIAVKAGIASDLGAFDHITYNVGANFEF